MSQKGFVKLLLPLIIVLAAAFFFWQKSTTRVEKEEPLKTPQVLDTDKTYQDDNLTFSLSYPSTLQIIKDTEEDYNQRNNGNTRKNFSGYVMYEPPKFLGAASVLDPTLEESEKYTLSPLTVWVFDNQSNLDAKAWYNKYWYYPFMWGVFNSSDKNPLIPAEEATISGRIAYHQAVTYQEGSPEYYYLRVASRMYLLRVISDTEGRAKKILNSFKISQNLKF